jgi:LacI family transcriptional regulator
VPDPQLEITSNWTIAGGFEPTLTLLDLPDPPTAIFCFNDNLAVGALRAARTREVRVPDELSIVGFDDTEEAAIVTPALTTVRQPLAEMGRMAVSLLVRLLDKQRVEALRVELATRLVVRESTGPPPR